MMKAKAHYDTTPISIARQRLEEEAAARRLAIESAANRRAHSCKEDWRFERAYRIRQQYAEQRAQRASAIAAAIGVAVMIAAAVSLVFIFMWAGFDPGMFF